MWRKVVSSDLLAPIPWRRLSFRRSDVVSNHFTTRFCASAASSSSAQTTSFSPPFSTGKKGVEGFMPIATGHEREELEAELQGKNILDINFPVGPFGTKEAPAIVQSVYDKRIVGCPGVEGEDEHDVVWFWLEKGRPHECPVCSQYFKLEVVGRGGPPDGHGGDHH